MASSTSEMMSSTPLPWNTDQFDVIDKKAFNGFYALCVALAILINIVVLVVVIVIIVRCPQLRASSLPKFLAVLLCCLTQLLNATFSQTVELLMNPARHTTLFKLERSPIPCDVSLASFYTWRILRPLSMLCVAVAVLTEVMRVMRVKTRRQMALSIFLLIMATAYSVAVIVPIVSVKIIGDRNFLFSPCSHDGIVRLNRENIVENHRILYAMMYLTPALIVIASIIALIIVSIITRRAAATRLLQSHASHRDADLNASEAAKAASRSSYKLHPLVRSATPTVNSTGGCMHQDDDQLQEGDVNSSDDMPASVPNSQTSSGPRRPRCARTQPCASPLQPSRTQEPSLTGAVTYTYTADEASIHSEDRATWAEPAPACDVCKKSLIPIDLLLAVVVTIVFLFPGFFHFFALEIATDFDWEIYGEYFKYVAGFTFLDLCWLFVVPCCWLAGAEIWTGVLSSIFKRMCGCPKQNDHGHEMVAAGDF